MSAYITLGPRFRGDDNCVCVKNQATKNAALKGTALFCFYPRIHFASMITFDQSSSLKSSKILKNLHQKIANVFSSIKSK